MVYNYHIYDYKHLNNVWVSKGKDLSGASSVVDTYLAGTGPIKGSIMVMNHIGHVQPEHRIKTSLSATPIAGDPPSLLYTIWIGSLNIQNGVIF